MPDEVTVPALQPDPGASPAPAAAPPPAALSQEPARPASDAVMLTKRELAEHIERAVARATEEFKKVMPEPKTPETLPPPSEDPIAKLRKEFEDKLAAQQAANQAAIDAANKRAEDAEKARQDAEKAKRRAREGRIEAQLKAEAAKAGIDDTDYALVLYARQAAAAAGAKDAKGEPSPQPPPEPGAFFASLRQSKPALFKGAPPANTAPGDVTVGGGAAPPPAKPGAAAGEPQEDDTDKLDSMAFSRRTMAKYGFNPGIGN